MNASAEIIAVRNEADLLHSSAELETVYERLSTQISARLQDADPLLMPVMHGGLYLCGQLLSRLDFPLEVDYLHATRYRDRLHGAELCWRVAPGQKVRERTVLVIDDILDDGITLSLVVEALKSAGAAEVLSVVLVTKQRPRTMPVETDFHGVEVPDRYVFGCGMDYKGYWRNLPDIYAV